MAAGLAADWDWENLGLFLVGGLVVVAWACACRGGPEVGGDDEGVALVAGLVAGAAVAMSPAATAATRDEPGGEAEGSGWFMAIGVGVASWAGVLVDVVWVSEVGCLLGKFWLNFSCYEVGWHCVGQENLLAFPHPWGKLQ